MGIEQAEYAADVDGTMRLLAEIRILGLQDNTRFYQASTSELYVQRAATELGTTLRFEGEGEAEVGWWPRCNRWAASGAGHWLLPGP